MKFLVIGNGGREHAIAWKLAQSPQITHVFVAPGNAGTQHETKVSNVAISYDDFAAITHFIHEQQITLTIIGPEAPLALGLVNYLQDANCLCLGPTQQAAQLEASKTFCKTFLEKSRIPTAAYQTFENYASAAEYITQQTFPVVIKADGLAAGKGVVIAENLAEALQAAQDMLVAQRFGAAGQRIIVEEYLQGQEASFIVLAAGEQVIPLATSQDHKTRDDGDRGPNTGGMGAHSPAPIITEHLQQLIMQQVIHPTLRGMCAEGHPYHGFLYAGLMIDGEQIRVLEFNCRFGDPETQPILMRLTSDFALACLAAAQEQLTNIKLTWDPQPAVGVVMASGGYPDNYVSGYPITGLTIAENMHNVKIFHASTSEQGGQIVTAGGRVLCVTALGKNTYDAQQLAYRAIAKIHWPDCYYRRDIAHRAIAVNT